MITFIGIDLSLNSTGICIIKENNNRIISVFKTENNIDKMFSRDDHIALINKCSEVNIILEKKEKNSKIEYYIRERHKIISFIKLTEFIINSLKDQIEGEVYIAMEGISFGSKGNSLIDISMATGILRKELINLLNGKDNHFFVYSPTTIKKFAGKGDFKKIDMFNAILDDTELNSSFIKLLRDNRKRMVTPKGIVKKPIEDIIDSIWVAKLLKYNIINKIF